MFGIICSNCCFVNFLLFIGTLIVLLKLYIKLTTGWCRSQTCLIGKTAIVTGANTGIGYETAIDLAKRGARVILACRNKEKADEACDNIRLETGNDNVIVQLVDFTSLESIRDFAKRINETEDKLDILVNNAGAGGLEMEYIGNDNLQITMLVNYYGPFLLTNLLLGLLKKSGPSRIVNVSSLMAKYAIVDVNNMNVAKNKWDIYGVSKLCNILFTIELANKLKNTQVTTYSLHPGVVATELMRKMPRLMYTITTNCISLLFKVPIEGAQTSIYCSVQKGIEHFNGEHFHDCHRVEKYKSVDRYITKILWETTEKLVKLTKEEIQY